jgi:hypothetical protein
LKAAWDEWVKSDACVGDGAAAGGDADVIVDGNEACPSEENETKMVLNSQRIRREEPAQLRAAAENERRIIRLMLKTEGDIDMQKG